VESAVKPQPKNLILVIKCFLTMMIIMILFRKVTQKLCMKYLVTKHCWIYCKLWYMIDIMKGMKALMQVQAALETQAERIKGMFPIVVLFVHLSFVVTVSFVYYISAVVTHILILFKSYVRLHT